MPIHIPPNSGRIEGRRSRRDRRLAALRPPRSIIRGVETDLDALIGEMILDMDRYAPFLTMGPSEAFDTLNGFLARWRKEFETRGSRISSAWAASLTDYSKEKIEERIARALGVDMVAIIDGGGFTEIVELASVTASQRITSISTEYVDSIGKAVLQNYRGEPLPDDLSLMEYIQKVGSVSKERAEFIARDQTATMTAMFERDRMLDAGVEEYKWWTSRDQRVVGNPSGRYPKPSEKHGNHYERHGKTFRWDDPPDDGHPGEPIGCRCTALPVFKSDALNIIR